MLRHRRFRLFLLPGTFIVLLFYGISKQSLRQITSKIFVGRRQEYGVEIFSNFSTDSGESANRFLVSRITDYMQRIGAFENHTTIKRSHVNAYNISDTSRTEGKFEPKSQSKQHSHRGRQLDIHPRQKLHALLVNESVPEPIISESRPTFLKERVSEISNLELQTFQGTSLYGEPGCFDNPWRKNLTELFVVWANITNQHNIDYVLGCGSLLGAMRNADVIPYDSDIDVLVDINWFSTLRQLSVQRNFDASDGKIRLLIQPQFHLDILPDSRKRFDCRGQVIYRLTFDTFKTPFVVLRPSNLTRNKLTVSCFCMCFKVHMTRNFFFLFLVVGYL